MFGCFGVWPERSKCICLGLELTRQRWGNRAPTLKQSNVGPVINGRIYRHDAPINILSAVPNLMISGSCLSINVQQDRLTGI